MSSRTIVEDGQDCEMTARAREKEREKASSTRSLIARADFAYAPFSNYSRELSAVCLATAGMTGRRIAAASGNKWSSELELAAGNSAAIMWRARAHRESRVFRPADSARASSMHVPPRGRVESVRVDFALADRRAFRVIPPRRAE